MAEALMSTSITATVTPLYLAEHFNRRFPVGTRVRYWPFLERAEGDAVFTRIKLPAYVTESGHVRLTVRGVRRDVFLDQIEVCDDVS